jgi:hypothetical protein
MRYLPRLLSTVPVRRPLPCSRKSAHALILAVAALFVVGCRSEPAPQPIAPRVQRIAPVPEAWRQLVIQCYEAEVRAASEVPPTATVFPPTNIGCTYNPAADLTTVVAEGRVDMQNRRGVVLERAYTIYWVAHGRLAEDSVAPFKVACRWIATRASGASSSRE